MFKKLVFSAVCLTFVVVIVGAYVRLQDAGLGCPDWPVEAHKTWQDMFHRYIAGALGGAAALLEMMVVINFSLSRTGSPA